MKTDCNVIRDLLPLVLDEAASAESRALVDAHLAECEACTAYRAGMKAVIPTTDAGSDHTIQVAVKRLRSTHLRRILRNVLIGLIIGVLLFVGASWGWDYLTHNCSRPTPLEDYSFGLVQLQDGRIVLTGYAHPPASFFNCYELALVDPQAGRVGYHSLQQPVIATRQEGTTIVTQTAILLPEELAKLGELRQGTPDNYIVFWHNGDVIPAASEQMEAYYAIDAEIDAMIHLADDRDGKAVFQTDDYFSYELLQLKLREAWYAVPEWNPRP